MTSVAESACRRGGRHRRWSASWLLAAAVLLLSTCAGEQPALRLAGDTMGTHYSITVVDPEERIDDAVLQQQVEQRLEEVNQTFSTYLEDSELNRFNRSAIDRWQPVSEDLYTVLLAATGAAWLSEGACDATIGRLGRLWGACADGLRGSAHAGSQAEPAL